MTVVVLDVPDPCWTDPVWNAPAWQELEKRNNLRRYRSTTIDELLDRGRNADVLVTCTFPLRREVLDYLTRVKHIVVPEDRADRLVEREIATQLGITVHSVPSTAGGQSKTPGSIISPGDYGEGNACRFFHALPDVLEPQL